MQFKLAIGDWSNDGHGHCEEYVVDGNMSSVDDLEDAYDILKAAGIAPDTFASKYEDKSITSDITKKLSAFLGHDIGSVDEYGILSNKSGSVVEGGPDGMAELVVALLNKANPELNLTIVKNDIPSWPQYGVKGKHFGYGLFWG